jgi:hypothetical protein
VRGSATHRLKTGTAVPKNYHQRLRRGEFCKLAYFQAERNRLASWPITAMCPVRDIGGDYGAFTAAVR